METEQKRQSAATGLGYFNLARGLGMILVVLGHTMNLYLSPSYNPSTGFFAGLGSVMGGGLMAAFFMISGFGFYKRSPGKCFTIQRKLLLFPYAVVAAAVIASKILLAVIRRRSFMENGGELILTYLLGLNAEGGRKLWGIPVDSVGIFWFVLALFGGWIIYNSIKQLSSERMQLILTAGCVILGYVLTLISRVWPYCLPMVFLAVGYLRAGEEIKKRNLLERKLSRKWYACILVCILISGSFGQVNIVACIWRLGLVDVFSTFAAGFLLLRLYALFMKREHSGKLVGMLEEIGFHSIWIVCLHAYEKVIFPWYRLTGALSSHPVLGVIICFFCRCAVMYILFLFISFFQRKMKRRKPGKIIVDQISTDQGRGTEK